MGAVLGMVGLGGGQSGTGVDGPQQANIAQAATADQANAAYTNVHMTLQQQQNLLGALQAQNGLGNQTQVYNQLQGVASGTGPNPAQAQYFQNAQDIAKQQAGAISSIQGISPAQRAALIAQQGSAAMQNAAAQGAVNQGNQQLGAMNAAGNMANAQAGQQIGQVNQNVSSQLAEQQNILGALGAQNSAHVASQSSVNSSNAALAGQAMQNQSKFIGGGLNAAGMALSPKSAFAAAKGTFAHGGVVGDGPRSGFGRHISMKGGGFVPGQAKVSGDSMKNDVVNAKLSPGEIVLPRSVVNSKKPDEAAAKFVAAVLAKKGKKK
jgi:hypothetical protein